jgi:hypothetical protein
LGRASNRDREWAQAEFSAADLGDKRRTVRLVELAQRLSERPEMSLPQALEQTAALKAAYRFFDNADIAHESVLAPHVLSSIGRMRTRPVVLAVQDTSYLDYGAHPATEALGPLSGEGGHGMIMHSTLAITPERLPLGVLSLRLWARDATKPKRRESRRTRTIQDKESHKWIESVQAMAALKRRLPGTRVVSVADRESDVFEFFTAARQLGMELLVRAAYDRNLLGTQARAFATLAGAPVLARKHLALPARGKRKARTAKLEIRACPLVFDSPRNGTAHGLPPLALWGVWVYEPKAPHGVEPLDWKLLTSAPVINAEDALERVEWYAARWGIEQWHKILKDGCRIEMRQLQSAERLKRLITVYAVIAWRIFYATLLARLVPDMSCSAILQQEEWEALYCRIHHTPIPVATPPPLRQSVHWIARLGGFLGRRGDGEPGSKTLWRGFQHLIAMTEMYRIMKPHMPATLQVSKDVGKD